jgi:hypothetical protein
MTRQSLDSVLDLAREASITEFLFKNEFKRRPAAQIF